MILFIFGLNFFSILSLLLDYIDLTRYWNYATFFNDI